MSKSTRPTKVRRFLRIATEVSRFAFWLMKLASLILNYLAWFGEDLYAKLSLPYPARQRQIRL